MYDWKNPLYQSASDAMKDMDLSSFRRIAEYFRLLGDYKNSASLYKACLDFPEKYFGSLLTRLHSARSQSDLYEIIRERDTLKETVGETVFQDEDWQNKDLAFQAALKKRQRLVFIFEHYKFLSLAGFFVLIVLFAFINNVSTALRPGRLISKGDRAFESGNYSEAVTYYEDAKEAGYHYWNDENFKEKLSEAQARAGKEAMENGDYNAAVSYLSDSGTNETADEVRLALSSLLAGEEDFYQAIKLLRQLEDQNSVEDTLKELYRKRAEKQVKAALDLEEPDPDKVGLLGKGIDDTDGLLSFTRAIVDAGYDPYTVFPGSIVVQDLKLDCDFSQAAASGKMPDLSKILVVYHLQVPVDDKPANMMYSVAKQEGSDFFEISTRVFPQILYSVKEPFRAETLSECTAFLVFHSYYLPTEPVEGIYRSTTQMAEKTGSFSTRYITYERHDEICLCSRKDPSVVYLLGEMVNTAPIFLNSEESGTSPVFSYTTSDLLKPASELFGQPDSQWVNSVMTEAVDLINQQED